MEMTQTKIITRKAYPSDISRSQFKQIEPLLTSFKKVTKPRTVDLYEVFCAILYVLKSGCQWRMLPDGFPKWRTVHQYFLDWGRLPDDGNGQSLLGHCLATLVAQARLGDGRKEKTSLLIVDAQSVKNTDSAGEKGYDAGKKVSGIKRHIGVDTQGLPHAIAVSTADVTDRNGAIGAVDKAKGNLSEVKCVLADGGYTGGPFAEAIQRAIGARVEIAKRNELHKFEVVPKRWVVERSFGWLEKCRRLWKNCEKKLNSSLQMIVIAFITILLKRL